MVDGDGFVLNGFANCVFSDGDVTEALCSTGFGPAYAGIVIIINLSRGVVWHIYIFFTLQS